MDMKIKTQDIETLKPYPENPKQHTKEQIRHIGESLKRFGWTQPVVVDEDNIILIGHGRVEAARLKGITQIPTMEAKELTKEQKAALVILDNELNQRTGFDSKLLDQAYKDLAMEGFPLEDFGLFLQMVGDAERGAGKDRDPVKEALKVFENAEKKQMNFYFTPEEHDKVVEDMTRIMDEKKIQTKGEFVFELLRNYGY